MITAIPLQDDDHTEVLEFVTNINKLILSGELTYEVNDDGEIKLYAS